MRRENIPGSRRKRSPGRRGVRAATAIGDLAAPETAARLVDDAAAAAGGPIDILVNNAGIIRAHDAAEYSDADWDDVMTVDLTSAFRLCRAAGATMLAARSR